MKLTEAIDLYAEATARPARGRRRQHKAHRCECAQPVKATCLACGTFCLTCGGVIVKGDTLPGEVKHDAQD